MILVTSVKGNVTVFIVFGKLYKGYLEEVNRPNHLVI